MSFFGFNLNEINRMAFIIEPNQRFADWINSHPDVETPITVAELREQSTVVLTPQFEDLDEARAWFHDMYIPRLMPELFGDWYMDDSWPDPDPVYANFEDWFTVRLLDHVLDYGGKLKKGEDIIKKWDRLLG